MGELAPGGLDQATQVLTGAFTAVGTTAPIAVYGSMNVLLWGTATTSMTTTASSSNVSVVSGTGLLAGQTVISPAGNVPNGTTLATFSGTSGTLAFPTVPLTGILNGTTTVTGLSRTTGLVGATVTGNGIPASTTVASITTAAVGGAGGVIVLSAAATLGVPSTQKQSPELLYFALTNASVVSGTDANAVFENVSPSATVQLERSFDGGVTWIICGVGGSGQPAQYTTYPISIVPAEPERGVLYRLNCVAFSSGVVNWRISITGSTTSSWGGIYGT